MPYDRQTDTLVINFTQALESIAQSQRDELAVAFARAALRCVEGWPWGKLKLMQFLSEELAKHRHGGEPKSVRQAPHVSS
jgi:hypothetical protein